MEKVIRDGKVAVLVSRGVGWYTWNKEYKQLLFNPKLVEMVEQNRTNEINEDWIKENLGIEKVYCGGVSDLIIHWLPAGTAFEVDEYEGHESLRTVADLVLIA